MQVVLEVAKTHNRMVEKLGYSEVTVTEMTEVEAAQYAQDYPSYGFFFVVAKIVPGEIDWNETLEERLKRKAAESEAKLCECDRVDEQDNPHRHTRDEVCDAWAVIQNHFGS